MERPTELDLAICGLTDGLREALASQERDYRRAGMSVDNKDRAELVVRFLMANKAAPALPSEHLG